MLNVHAFGLYQLVRDSLVRDGLSETEAQRIDSVVAARVEEHPSTVDEWFGRAKGADLLLIHLESVQGFVVGAQYAEQPITPFLDRWMGTEAIRFDEIYDQTHQGRTSDAQFMVFNGLHPFEQGSVVFQRENNRFVALPSVLGAAGYSTAAAFPYERGFWNTARMFQAWGFESARYAEDFGVRRFKRILLLPRKRFMEDEDYRVEYREDRTVAVIQLEDIDKFKNDAFVVALK